MHGSLDFEGFQGTVQRGITTKLQQQTHLQFDIFRLSICSLLNRHFFRGSQQPLACVSQSHLESHLMTSDHFLLLIFEFSQNVFENINKLISSYFIHRPCTCKIIIFYPIISSYIMKHCGCKRYGALACEFSVFPRGVNAIFFSDVRQPILAVSYARFGETYRSHLETSSLTLDKTNKLSRSVGNYQYTLQNISEEPCHIPEPVIVKL